MENEDVGDNKRRRLLISRLSGDASELGVKLAVEGKDAKSIITALRERFGKSFWQTMEELVMKLEVCRTETVNSVFVGDIQNSYASIPEIYRKHEDFSLFHCLYLSGESFRKKIIGENFLQVIDKKERLDTNSLVGKLNLEEGVEKTRKESDTPVNQEVIDLTNINQKKMQCFYCGKYGHKKVDCFKYKNAQKSFLNTKNKERTPTSVNAINTVDFSNFYVDIFIEGKSFPALIDTGAAASIIHGNIVADVKKEKCIREKDIKLLSANGGEINTGGIIKLKIQMSNKEFKWDFIVVEKLEHLIIIGLDILKHHFSSISLTDNSLSVNSITKGDILQNYKELFKFSKQDYGITNVKIKIRISRK